MGFVVIDLEVYRSAKKDNIIDTRASVIEIQEHQTKERRMSAAW